VPFWHKSIGITLAAVLLLRLALALDQSAPAHRRPTPWETRLASLVPDCYTCWLIAIVVTGT